MNIERAFIPLESKAIEGGNPGQFEGWGSIFGNVDLGGDIVAAGAFTETLEQHRKAGTMPSMFASHDPGTIIGEYLEMREEAKGLWVSGQLWVAGVPGREAVDAAGMYYNQMKSAGVSGLSIGYIVEDAAYEEQDGKTVRVIKKCDLIEVSPTSMPMNQQALTTSVKSVKQANGHLLSVRDFEKIMQDAGLTRKEARILLNDGYKALLAKQDAGEPDEQEATVASLESFIQRFKGG